MLVIGEQNSSLGDREQLHCYELLSKMTPRACSGNPRVPYIVHNYSLGDSEQLHCYELLSKMTLRPCSGHPRVP